MDTDTDISVYYDLCRLCLKTPGEDNLFEKKDLVQDIFLCTGVKIIKSDTLPPKICPQCLEVVTRAKQLRNLAETNEAYMRILFNNGVNIHATSDDTNYEQENTSHNKDAGNSLDTEDQYTTENLKVDMKIIKSKRCRSSSLEDEPSKRIAVRKDLFECCKALEPSKGIAVRKDLFKPSEALALKIKDYTYIEGTKYGISKKYTVNNKNEAEISYMCGLCPKSFTNWKKVYCHQRSHSKNIQCNIDGCEKKFATNGDLKKHMRIHTGERPFVCNICDKSFSQGVTLRVHKETVHQVETLVVYC